MSFFSFLLLSLSPVLFSFCYPVYPVYSQTQIVTKLKLIVTKLKKTNCDHSKTLIVTVVRVTVVTVVTVAVVTV